LTLADLNRPSPAEVADILIRAHMDVDSMSPENRERVNRMLEMGDKPYSNALCHKIVDLQRQMKIPMNIRGPHSERLLMQLWREGNVVDWHLGELVWPGSETHNHLKADYYHRLEQKKASQAPVGTLDGMTWEEKTWPEGPFPTAPTHDSVAQEQLAQQEPRMHRTETALVSRNYPTEVHPGETPLGLQPQDLAGPVSASHARNNAEMWNLFPASFGAAIQPSDAQPQQEPPLSQTEQSASADRDDAV
jgi:hypothetical protein